MSTRLSYVAPTTVTADATTTVWIRATNTRDEPVTVTEIVLLVPHGTGPGQLTDDRAAEVQCDVRGDLTPADPRVLADRKVLRLAYGSETGCPLAPDGYVDLGFRIHVNADAGPQVTIAVSERTAGVPAADGSLVLPLVPTGVAIGGLRAEAATVRAGTDPVHLLWNASTDTAAFDYTLTYTTPAGTATVHPAGTDTVWPPDDTLRLTRDTLFRLTAAVTPRKGPRTTVDMGTFVHVSQPDLATSGLLTADREVELLQHRRNHAGYVPGYSSWSADGQQGIVDTTLQAVTDGLLLVTGTLTRDAPADTVLPITVTLRPTGQRIEVSITGDRTDDVLLPVRAGQSVGLHAEPTADVAYKVVLHWSPFGTGALLPP
ncbi:hypothetical protein ACFRAR_15910 [Kitasatospora sp. NPDC056651]|uniref:hypothetical protein n=1 Tax=Kitasatospora sp. NPDC056651 TaxID=3345892 RepID=UPI00368D1434